MLTPVHKNACLFLLALFTACFVLFDKVEPWLQTRMEGYSLPTADHILLKTAWVRERLGLAKAFAVFDDAVSPIFSETYKNRHAYVENEATLRLAAQSQSAQLEALAVDLPSQSKRASTPDAPGLEQTRSTAALSQTEGNTKSGGSPESALPASPSPQAVFSTPTEKAQAQAQATLTPPAQVMTVSLGGLSTEPTGPRFENAPEQFVQALAPVKGKVLVVGDSLSMALGLALEKAVKSQADLSVVQRGKLSSGLQNPQFFNWVSAMGDFLPEHKPSLVIVMMGGNDAKYLSVQEEQGRFEAVNNKRLTAYRERLAHFLAVFDRFGIPCLWVGLPVMGDDEYDKQCRVLNNEVKKAIEGSKWTRFLDTRGLLADDQGRYAQYAQLPKSGRVRIREMDKVHFNVAGGDILVAHMAPEVTKLLEKRPAQAERSISSRILGPGAHAHNIAEMAVLPD